MAVRSVLLSDIQSVLSLARKRYGYLLSSSTGQKPKQDNPLSVFQSFALIRGRLLRSENMAELSPVSVVKPFLDVIRHQNASSTVTGAALQAVMNFLHSWPWAEVKDQNAAADAVACSEFKIPVVCLELIRLLWSKLRSDLKMQVETIFNGVFNHALHWTIANLDVNNPDFPRGDDTTPPAGSANGEASEKSVVMVDAATDEFSGEMLSQARLFNISFEILDCLVDLLAEATLLPDLYVNYDCDGNRCDLTQNLFELLSQVVQQSHVACFESHEETHFLWAQAVGEIALRGMFNALYVVHLRTQPQTNPVVTDGSSSSSVPSDDEGHEDTLLVEQEEQQIPINAAGFASAEILYKKRQRKKFFQHGIQEFNRKPMAGIKYLQQNTFLPTPLDSMSLATFLRSLPQGLNKNAVGVYLGAMGKEVKGFEKTDIHEADTMDFHRDVLTNFVRSFNFEGESIVAALRMFLASFRLPGEAQQIDRILNTFSLQVYEQCRERFLMASVDVAYLLSFSLIMLNTDLHNPNIRADKKMKLLDFIKNNKNYGQEVSKGLDLPEDFLTELYDTIAKDEIKTFEDGGKHGEVTSDRTSSPGCHANNEAGTTHKEFFQPDKRTYNHPEND
ncbi:hypothetical protein JM18_002540 [Phytophthora kernoviae]|uniref:SEC7 domain-containing protein n=2 Tax=Phytophthora kernoviae TaxID=325452 RepID=A0A921VBU3_9STRA|nr:hypothetical protein G195_003455 [Phytophthora kernoviae 00238/432]KAG2529069.1 hypothetical protein JM18_002540 [Phytophthora kernoviae]